MSLILILHLWQYDSAWHYGYLGYLQCMSVYVSVCHTSVISNRHNAAQQKKQVQKHKPPSTQIYQKKSSSKLGLSTMRHSHSCRSFRKIRNFAPQKNSTANYMLKFAIIIVIAAGCISFSTSASQVFIWTSHHPSRIFAHICNAWRWPHEFSSVCLRALTKVTKVKQGIDWLMAKRVPVHHSSKGCCTLFWKSSPWTQTTNLNPTSGYCAASPWLWEDEVAVGVGVTESHLQPLQIAWSWPSSLLRGFGDSD